MTLLTGYWGLDNIIILSSVVIAAYLYMTRNFNYWRKRGVLEIQPTAFVGNFGSYFWKNSLSNLLKNLYDQAKGQPYIGFYIYDTPALLICDNKLLQTIFIRDFNYFTDRYAMANQNDRVGYANLFSIKNPGWKDLRAKLTPFFSSAKMKNILTLMLQNARNLENHLDTLELEGKYIIYKSNVTKLYILFEKFISNIN